MKTVIPMIVSLLLACSVVSAKSGKAIVPTFETWDSGSSNYKRGDIHISNITDEPVSVFITLYDSSGNILTDGDGSPSSGNIKLEYTASAYDDNLSDASVTFTLAANSSAYVRIMGDGTTKTLAYGSIEWEQISKNTVALVAHSTVQEYKKVSGEQSRSTYSLPINNGLPF